MPPLFLLSRSKRNSSWPKPLGLHPPLPPQSEKIKVKEKLCACLPVRWDFHVPLQDASVHTELWSSAEYLREVACINRKRGTKPAEESVSI
jgi:hypothetical protein